MAAVFIAQATNTPMTLMQEITLLAVLLLTSKGAAGITGSGFIVLAATLSAVGTVPVVGLTLILGIDRFMSEARALTNLIGNGVATLVVSRSENAFDDTKRAAAEAAIGPVYDMADIATDPHYAARDAVTTVGDTPMQGLIARLSATPGRLGWAGKRLDADGEQIRRSGWS